MVTTIVKELLASKGITEKTKYHSYEYLYKSFLEVSKLLEIKLYYKNIDSKKYVDELIKTYPTLIVKDNENK